MNYAELRSRDLKHIWHPYTEISAFEQSAFPIVERAAGCVLRTMDGRELLDGTSSWWCVNLGHSHPALVEAIQRQAAQLQHVLLGGSSHPPAIELAGRLARIAPGRLGHAMFAADGSCAVEAALKIAIQYWYNLGRPRKCRLIALEDGYHGDSLGAAGAGYIEAFHRPFRDVLQPALRAESPYCNKCPYQCKPETCALPCFESMRQAVRRHHQECAAVIVEPLCQAAAGIRIYPPEYLVRLRKLCDEHELLLICDEIAVGFGRTGAMFACQKAGIAPDILTLGKGLTGGMLPMSATLVSDAVYDAFRKQDGTDRTFYHGHTFCGNPITSAAAVAALDVFEREHVLEDMPPKSAFLESEMRQIAALLGGSPVRVLGMIAAIELDEAAGGKDRVRRIAARACELGLLIRPLGSVLYLWPPLTASQDTLARMTALLRTAVSGTPK